jgi:hypothetical protein
MVSEEVSAFTRGRIPAHEIRDSMEVSYLLLQAKPRMSRHQFLMFEIDAHNFFDFGTQQSTLPVAAGAYISMISDHYMSHDRFSRPYKM